MLARTGSASATPELKGVPMAVRLIKSKEVATRAGVSVSVFRYFLRTDPTAPEVIRLSRRVIRFDEDDVDRWINSKRVRRAPVAAVADAPCAPVAPKHSAPPATSPQRRGRPRKVDPATAAAIADRPGE
jgi:predicted DNA-binding transcriptional regulator AlpA